MLVQDLEGSDLEGFHGDLNTPRAKHLDVLPFQQICLHKCCCSVSELYDGCGLATEALNDPNHQTFFLLCLFKNLQAYAFAADFNRNGGFAEAISGQESRWLVELDGLTLNIRRYEIPLMRQ